MVNTAATAMIIPIVMAILKELRVSQSQVEHEGVENKASFILDG